MSPVLQEIVGVLIPVAEQCRTVCCPALDTTTGDCDWITGKAMYNDLIIHKVNIRSHIHSTNIIHSQLNREFDTFYKC